MKLLHQHPELRAEGCLSTGLCWGRAGGDRGDKGNTPSHAHSLQGQGRIPALVLSPFSTVLLHLCHLDKVDSAQVLQPQHHPALWKGSASPCAPSQLSPCPWQRFCGCCRNQQGQVTLAKAVPVLLPSSPAEHSPVTCQQPQGGQSSLQPPPVPQGSRAQQVPTNLHRLCQACSNPEQPQNCIKQQKSNCLI